MVRGSSPSHDQRRNPRGANTIPSVADFSILQTVMMGLITAIALPSWLLEQPPGLTVTAHRPAPSSWKRTLCGSPSGSHPATPAGPYTIGVDHPGADIPPCGSQGCVLTASASYLDCETKCNVTKGCYAYVFAPANCSGAAGPICWTKAAASGSGQKAQCRNSRQLATPATEMADIPSKWAAQVSADKTPLIKYPRPQMVRGSGMTPTLREDGDPSVWSNLNGLWVRQPGSNRRPVGCGA